jgi:hypothetical protein
MAISVTNQANPLGNRIVQDTDADGTAATNTTGTSGTLYYVEIDNSLNVGAVYVKFADNTTATAGTTAADLVVLCAGSSKKEIVIPNGIPRLSPSFTVSWFSWRAGFFLRQ